MVNKRNRLSVFLHKVSTDDIIGDNGTKIIVEFLKVNKSVTTLNLGGTNVGIGLKGARAIAEVLKENSTLRKLNFSVRTNIKEVELISKFEADNKIGPEGVKALSEALRMNSTLVSLNINDINLIFSIKTLLMKKMVPDWKRRRESY